MKSDIKTKEDVIILVNTFYTKVKTNDIIGYIFNDVAKINWEEHLPKMYLFWNGVLFGESGFTGNPMYKHILLSKITPMTTIEFNEWLRLFNETVDELFEGEKSTEAKLRANNIANLMLHKIELANNQKN